MAGNEGKRMADNYEITTAVRVGGKEVVFGENEASSDSPYLCAFYTTDGLIGAYSDCMVGNFLEIMKLFGERIQAQAQMVLDVQEQFKCQPEQLTADHCYPNDYSESIKGKLVAVTLESLAPEYQSTVHQLIFVTGGNGAMARPHGHACFGVTLYNGLRTRRERYSILGEVKPEYVPEWAKERLAVFQREQAEKKAADREDR